MANNPYHIKYFAKRKSENKYQLSILCYEIDNGQIKYDYKFIDYFKSEFKAKLYFKRNTNDYKTELLFSDVYNALIEYKDTPKGYYKVYKYSYDKIPSFHNKNIFDITANDITSIILSFDTFSIRKKLRLLFSQIYKYLISQGIDIEDLSKDINIPRISNKNIQYNNYFTEEEIIKMTSDYYDDFVYDMLMFMIHTGIKTYTLFQVKISDIDIANNRINTHDEAVNKVIILDDLCKDILKKYYSNNKTYLFELNDKQIEYTVYKRYHFIPFINHYGFNHKPQDSYATYLRFKGDKEIMARRREKGTGGIKYRKGRNLPYEAQITITEDGEPKRVTIGKYATEDEAVDALNRYNHDASTNDKTKFHYTFAEVYEKMVEYRTITKASKDPDSYKAAFSAVPMLHDKRFSTLTHNDLFKAMIDSKKNYPTVKKIKLLYKLMYNYAIAEKIVAHDETLAIKISENSSLFPYEKKIIHQAFKEDEIKELLSDELNPEMVKIFKFLIHTGLRINEFYTLTKDSVNLNDKTISIKEEYAKTASSERIVPIHPSIFDIVLEKYNKAKYPHSPLFTTPTGKAFLDRNFRDAYWHPFLENHNMHHFPHDTRYTFSTFWSYLNLATRDGETILGHSRKTDMEKLYKTPELKHLHAELAKLKFDLSDALEAPKETPSNDIDDFKKMKAEMQKLGFDSMQEYMEYLEFKKLRSKA